MKKTDMIFDENYSGALTISHLSKFYGENDEVKALNDVSLQFFTGQFVVILGASGSGKSTLLNLIGGMDNATAGSIQIAGVDITKLPEKVLTKYRKEVVGFIFQFYNLMPNLTVLENVELSELPGGMKAIDAIKMVDLEDKKDNKVFEWSKAQHQYTIDYINNNFTIEPYLERFYDSFGFKNGNNINIFIDYLKNLS